MFTSWLFLTVKRKLAHRWPPFRDGLIWSMVGLAVCAGDPCIADPPALPREFRAVWIATVANIDWPSQPGLSSELQQQELRALLDRAVELHLNAVVFQVRPAADAFYESELEPWSAYLTGAMGTPPDPPYDPLEFAIRESHQRGLELHAWFNPYRALHKTYKQEVSPDHISETHPDFVRTYDGYLWLDPGDRSAMRHTLNVMIDVTRRYDIDGVHLDDYFYPYPISDESGSRISFPDETTWQNADTQMTRDDWRRENVNLMIQTLYREVKAIKPWVKVGISPFGIWRPGQPEGIKGFDAYAELYADARRWLQEGWLDYVAPQLYWQIESAGQSYPKLLSWWDEQNRHRRHLWPGNFASRVGMEGERAWPAKELIRQISLTRDLQGATGNIHFSAKAFQPDYGPLGESLRSVYDAPALVPASPWLNDESPGRPLVDLVPAEETRFELRLRSETAPWQWAVQWLDGHGWSLTVLPGNRSSVPLPNCERVAVSMISRTGIAGPRVMVETKGR